MSLTGKDDPEGRRPRDAEEGAAFAGLDEVGPEILLRPGDEE